MHTSSFVVAVVLKIGWCALEWRPAMLTFPDAPMARAASLLLIGFPGSLFTRSATHGRLGCDVTVVSTKSVWWRQATGATHIVPGATHIRLRVTNGVGSTPFRPSVTSVRSKREHFARILHGSTRFVLLDSAGNCRTRCVENPLNLGFCDLLKVAAGPGEGRPRAYPVWGREGWGRDRERVTSRVWSCA
jgi:hypothetical protein